MAGADGNGSLWTPGGPRLENHWHRGMWILEEETGQEGNCWNCSSFSTSQHQLEARSVSLLSKYWGERRGEQILGTLKHTITCTCWTLSHLVILIYQGRSERYWQCISCVGSKLTPRTKPWPVSTGRNTCSSQVCLLLHLPFLSTWLPPLFKQSLDCKLFRMGNL